MAPAAVETVNLTIVPFGLRSRLYKEVLSFLWHLRLVRSQLDSSVSAKVSVSSPFDMNTGRTTLEGTNPLTVITLSDKVVQD